LVAVRAGSSLGARVPKALLRASLIRLIFLGSLLVVMSVAKGPLDSFLDLLEALLNLAEKAVHLGGCGEMR
jgi:hypothetical protein